jgi:hypothetical protein
MIATENDGNCNRGTMSGSEPHLAQSGASVFQIATIDDDQIELAEAELFQSVRRAECDGGGNAKAFDCQPNYLAKL